MTSLAAVVLAATTVVRDLDRPSSPDRQGRVRHAAANRRRPRHVQVLVVGDSVAFTLGFSLTGGGGTQPGL